MRINSKPARPKTHEGAPARNVNAEQQLRRSLLSCFLWEKEFYEDGVSIAKRIPENAAKCSTEFVAQLALQARHEYHIRHASLWLAVSLLDKTRLAVVNDKGLIRHAIESVINRPDEMMELVALYQKDGRKPIPKVLQRALGGCFNKFDEYQFAKYDRPGKIKLRTLLDLVHAKPKNENQEMLFGRIMNNELAVPDTWEAKVAAGKEDDKTLFTDLLKRKKLGYMATLRNLSRMLKAGVDIDLIKKSLDRQPQRILPYRFIAAARYAPQLERELDQGMQRVLANEERLSGRTILLVDVSRSMNSKLSVNSEMTRKDAASGLAVLLSGICEQLRIFTFSEYIVEVPPRKGMGLVDAIEHSQRNWSTYLGRAVRSTFDHEADRLIVLTDEQSHDPVPNPKLEKSYMINVASNRYGVGYQPWVHIDGFSEATVKFIQALEKEVIEE